MESVSPWENGYAESFNGKLLLATIAFGLWMNVAVNLFRPIEVQAQSDLSIQSIRTTVAGMQITLNSIAAGLCLNDKLC